MDHGADGLTSPDGQSRLDTSFPIFTPVVTTGTGWDYVAVPQRDARTACMLLAAALWKQDPGICLATLESQVENAVGELEQGAQMATIGDDTHRVWRTDIVIDIPLRRPYRPGRLSGS
jgi:hypothetical protein